MIKETTLFTNMNEIPFQIEMHLGRAVLTREEFDALSPGDIIVLDQLTEAPLEVTIGKDGKLKGFAGVRKGYKAMKLESVHE